MAGLLSLKNYLSRYFDVVYFLKFIFLLLALFYFNLFYIAITDWRGMVYSPFLEHHLNYIDWLRNSVLYTSNAIVHLFGINSYIIAPYRIKIPHGPYVETVYACLGLGLMSFWVAFVSAHKSSWKKKIAWNLVGILCIWFINCWRVALLLIALQHDNTLSGFVDHHTLFNIFAYALIILLIYLHAKVVKRKEQTLLIQ